MKLSRALYFAIQSYYFNRYRNKEFHIAWNKGNDLNVIDNAKPKGYRFEAAAGTFFFTRYTTKYSYTYIFNEKTFPIPKIEKKKR